MKARITKGMVLRNKNQFNNLTNKPKITQPMKAVKHGPKNFEIDTKGKMIEYTGKKSKFIAPSRKKAVVINGIQYPRNTLTLAVADPENKFPLFKNILASGYMVIERTFVLNLVGSALGALFFQGLESTLSGGIDYYFNNNAAYDGISAGDTLYGLATIPNSTLPSSDVIFATVIARYTRGFSTTSVVDKQGDHHAAVIPRINGATPIGISYVSNISNDLTHKVVDITASNASILCRVLPIDYSILNPNIPTAVDSVQESQVHIFTGMKANAKINIEVKYVYFARANPTGSYRGMCDEIDGSADWFKVSDMLNKHGPQWKTSISVL